MKRGQPKNPGVRRGLIFDRDRLKVTAAIRGFSFRELAEQLGMRSSTFYAKSEGQLKWLVSELAQLEEILGVSVSWLADGVSDSQMLSGSIKRLRRNHKETERRRALERAEKRTFEHFYEPLSSGMAFEQVVFGDPYDAFRDGTFTEGLR